MEDPESASTAEKRAGGVSPWLTTAAAAPAAAWVAGESGDGFGVIASLLHRNRLREKVGAERRNGCVSRCVALGRSAGSLRRQ